MEYVITLKLAGDTYQGTGTTSLEALRSLPKPLKIMNKGVLTITRGEKTKTIIYFPARLKRLFYTSPSLQAVHAKQLGALV